MSKRKGRGGRRGKYHEWLTSEGLIKLEGWARDGLTNEQIARNIGITSETLRVWINTYSVLSASLKRGKEVIDREVENALLKRALGYEFEEKKYVYVEMSDEEHEALKRVTVSRFKLDNPEATLEEIRLVELQVSKYKSVLVEVKTKEVSPDTTAQIFWLKNRKPVEWRDRQELKVDGAVGVQIIDDIGSDDDGET